MTDNVQIRQKGNLISEITEILERAVCDKVVPGAVFWGSAGGGETIHCVAVGQSQVFKGARACTLETLFDLASLTKPLVTGLCAMLMVQEGLLDLNMPVGEVIPSWNRGTRSKVRVFHLLGHTSGLPGWVPLYRQVKPFQERTAAMRERVVSAAARLELEVEPGTRCVYSDLGYILLESILTQVGEGRTPHNRVAEQVWRPLQLDNTFFMPANPGPGVVGVAGGEPVIHDSDRFAATENCPWRQRVLVGEVHDENAHAMGGVAGHAGLFSSAREVHALGRFLLDARQGRSRLLSAKVLQRFWDWHQEGLGDGTTWSLGWDRPSRGTRSSGGTLPSDEARGHLGFTGTSLWIDPKRDAVAVLLTNRVHFGRGDLRIKDLRPLVHDTFWRGVDGQSQ